MPVYQYTMKKYLKSPSTWIISVISFILIFLLGGYVAFKRSAPDNPEDYARLAIGLVAGITGFLAIFTSVFAGFKSATMFKDEVEDGTFLVLLSKPVRRSTIIYMKWFALQTIIVFYTLFVALSFLLTILAFDNGSSIKNINAFYGLKTIKSQVILISLYMWMILMVSSLIFSSIALLLSTKLTVGATIGISIALGVIIPVTSLVSTFTKKSEFTNVTNNAYFSPTTFTGNKQVDDLFKKMEEWQRDPYFIYNYGARTGQEDSFKTAWIFDINFQFNTLSNYAYSLTVPTAAENLLSNNSFSGNGFLTSHTAIDPNNKLVDDKKENLEQLKYSIAYTWETLADVRKEIYTLLSAWLLTNYSIFEISRHTAEDLEKINVHVDMGVDKPHLLQTDVVKILGAFTKIEDKSADIKEIGYAILVALDLTQDISNSIGNSYADFLKLLDKDNLNADKNPVDYQTAQILSYGVRLTSLPLNISPSSFIKDQKIEVDDAAAPSRDITVGGKTIKDSIALGLVGQKEMLFYDNYKDATSMINQGYPFVKVTYKKYAKRSTILYSYLIIAFALLPLAYFVIRKQDFR